MASSGASSKREPTHIGFTGNQLGYDAGASIAERGERGKTMFRWLVYLRHHYKTIIGHHGDCMGSDRDFHNQCRGLGIPRILHPPYNESKRAFAHKSDGLLYTITAANTSMILAPGPYLDRNHAIVDSTALLLATPRGRAEEQRSGTWATVRYARAARKWIIIVYPDGTWQDEGPRPAWCMIKDGRFIAPDELGHRWDGDTCIACGFDATDANAWHDDMPNTQIPTCREWRALPQS